MQSSSPKHAVVQQIGAESDVKRVEELFEIGEEIGRGAFGRVCRAKECRGGGVDVALKIMAKGAGGGILEKFGSDLLLQALTVLRHPNLVEFLSFAEDGQNVYAAMELCTGGDLLDYVSERAPLDLKEATTLSVQIFSVLDYMHSRGGMHRDIKPENFMFSDATRTVLKLVDMGSFVDANAAKTLHVVGTVGFTAPEVFLGKACFASDVFSAAVITTMLLNGGWPDFMAPEDWYELDGEEAFEAYKKSMQKLDRSRIREWADSVGLGSASEFFASLLDPQFDRRPTSAVARDYPWHGESALAKPLRPPSETPPPLKRTYSNTSSASSRHGLPTAELVSVSKRIQSWTPPSAGAPAAATTGVTSNQAQREKATPRKAKSSPCFPDALSRCLPCRSV